MNAESNVEAIEKFLREARTPKGESPLQDPQVNAVIDRVWASQRYPEDGGPRANPSCDPADYADYGFSIFPAQGDLIYLLCRAMRATRVVEFATSVGLSTLYFAAAMRDNGGGTVIGSELVPSKVLTARRNIDEAGLSRYVDIREGDGRQTLKDLGGPVDFALIDGWPLGSGPSLARQVIEIVAPQIRIGGFLMNDNGEPDYMEFIRDPSNGFLSVKLPIKGGTELSVKIS
ncbi:O-methyltransferase [Caballeronia sp. 15715]|jgi:predicted O-methyltransferase YrrM|uniref:O-methyltransferase n=1 Tax=unclassified Caballeronia TaxID=2646786 RepID=UPI0039E21D7A